MQKIQNGLVVMTIVIAFFAIPTLTWAAGPEHGSMPMMEMMWGGWGMMFGPLMMIVFIAVIVIVIVLIIRWLGGAVLTNSASPPRPAEKTALDILKERFARGEIDKDEFEEKRRLLSD